MGQSFRALIRRQGKRKAYDPHSKLMEHASLGWADVVGAVVSDIHHLPSHVVWSGEWSPSLPFFDEAWGVDVITESYDRTDVSENPRYIVNHSKHLYRIRRRAPGFSHGDIRRTFSCSQLMPRYSSASSHNTLSGLSRSTFVL